jgi:TonB family protein
VNSLQAEKIDRRAIQEGGVRLRLSKSHLGFALAPEAFGDVEGDLRHRRDTAWGLLLGSTGIGKAGDRFVTVHESVPLYSAADDQPGASLVERVLAVEDLVLGWSLSQQLPVRPVGFYIVCARQHQVRIERELHRLKKYGRDDVPVVLCIRPHGAADSGPVVIADDGGQAAALAVPFAFSNVAEEAVSRQPAGAENGIEHTNGDTVHPRTMPPPAGAIEAPPRAMRAAETRLQKPRSLSWLSIVLALITLVLIVAVVRLSQNAGFFTAPRPQTQTAPTSALDLQIGRKGGDLEITWSRSAAIVQSAQRGFLYIADGTQRTQVFLEEGHLKTGRVLYVPHSSDLEVRLEVVTPDDRIVRESLKVIVATGASPAAGNAALQPATATSERPSREAATRAPAAAGDPKQSAAVASQQASSDSEPEDQPRKVFLAPPDRRSSQPAGTARIEPVPDAAIPVSLNAGPALPQPQISRPAPPVAPPPVVEQPRTSSEAAQADTAAARPAVTAATYEPPVPLRKPALMIPPFVRNMMRGDVSVPVTVAIDENGKVTQARVTEQGASAASYLSRLAKSTAERWQFKPALRNGKATQSEFTIVFRIAHNTAGR